MAIQASDIVDKESFEDWLEEQPADAARVIATRNALRVLPIGLSVNETYNTDLTDKDKLGLTRRIFQNSFMTWVVRKYPAETIIITPSYSFLYIVNSESDNAFASIYAHDAGESAIAAEEANVNETLNQATTAIAFAEQAVDESYFGDRENITLPALCKDADWLENNSNKISSLINQPLWIENVDILDDYSLLDIMKDELDTFRQSDLAQNTSFGLIADWYAALLPEKGKPRSLFGKKKDLELAKQPKAFWEGEAQEVMDRVAGLVGWRENYWKPKTRFFISYSTKDEVAAKFIGGVIEGAGYQVFAQYKDMPTGSVFIEEMKRGLAGSDRFVPIYSPYYEESDFCQAEWNAAFRLDPLGLKRKMLPFLIEPTELNQLASPIIYTNLVNQPEDERREKILSALDDGGGLTRKEQRKKLAASASPQIVENEDDQLDTAPNEEFDQPINDPALVQLLADILKILKGLCKQFEDNNQLAVFHNALVTYQDEIEVSGVGLRMGTLERAINVIRDEIEEDSQKYWYKGGAKESLTQFLAMHQALGGFYPKTDIRKQLEENADIDQEYLSSEKMDSDLVEFEQTLILTDLEGKISKRLFSLIQQQVYLVKQLLQLEVKGQPLLPDDIFVSEEDKERKRQNEKKKQGASFGSLLDNMLARIEKINSIANSDTGKGLMNAAAKIVSKIWWGT